MKIVFAAITNGYFRNIESIIDQLAARGHDIYLGAEKRDTAIGGQAIVDRLTAAHPRVVAGPVPQREELAFVASKLRLALDYLRYLHPMYTESSGLRARAEDRMPIGIVHVCRSRWMSLRPVQWLSRWLLDAADRALPPSAAIERFIEEQQPDLLVVTPLIGLTTASQLDVLRTAQARGIPTVVIVWSWDHLSSKAIIRDDVDGLFVWNGAQEREAQRMHGVARKRIVVTGAHCFDKWFGRQPSRSRAGFLRHVGLPEDRPYVLWVCSALLQGSPPEPGLVLEWARHLRASADPRLRDLPILIRPHPSRLQEWQEVDWRSLGNVALFGDNPIDDAARDDYFDSLYHSAAVVGITTSAFLEAAIVDRPVMTIFMDEVRQEHEGSLHFQLLRKYAGGLITTADTLEEHARQLAAMVDGPPRDVIERQQRFVKAFLRPDGLDRPATGTAVAALEAIGAAPSRVKPRQATAIGRRALGKLVELADDPQWRPWFLDPPETARANWIEEKRRRSDQEKGHLSTEEKVRRREERRAAKLNRR
jgi:hypothetical protein